MNLFVYGTLRPGGALSSGYFSAEQITEARGRRATMAGRLYSLGAYPVMVPGPSRRGRVVGNVVDVSPRDLRYIAMMEMRAGYYIDSRVALLDEGGEARCLVFLVEEEERSPHWPRLPDDDWFRQAGEVDGPGSFTYR